MKDIKKKIKLIFVPYLIISLATLIGWTFLHWLLFIKLDVFPVNVSVLVIFVPLVISFLFVVFGLNKKLKLLNLESDTRNFSIIYLAVPILTIGSQSLFAQQYIELITGKLTHLSSINQIDKKELTKYYTIRNFYLDKKHFSVEKHSEVAGKHNQNFEMQVFITVPILNSGQDTLNSKCVGWYGVRYNETVANNITENDANNEYISDKDVSKVVFDDDKNQSENTKQLNRFAEECMMKFDADDANKFVYLQRIGKTESGNENYVSAIKNNTKYDTTSDIILEPVNEPFEARGDDDLRNTLMIFGGGTLLFFIMLLFVNLKDSENKTAEINL